MIGAFRHVVTLQEDVLTPDNAGGFTHGWQDVADTPQLHVAMTAITSAVAQRHGRNEQVSVYRLRGRYRAAVTPGMRLCWGNKILLITAVADPDGQARWIDIEAEEQLAGI